MSRSIIRTNRFVAIAMSSLWLIAPGSQAGAAGMMLAQAGPGAPPAQNVEANISSLHQKLQITPGQEAQFNAVATVMRNNARAQAGAPQQPPANASAVDDLRTEIQYDEVE